MTHRQDSSKARSNAAANDERPAHWERRARRALSELESLGKEIRSSLREAAPEARLDAVSLSVLLMLRGGGRSRPTRARQLVEALEKEVKESLLASAAFERGRVFCLRCENSICEHSLPPSPRDVFTGYGQTGRPEWKPFDTLLSERKDPRAGLLYEAKRPLLSLAQSGTEVYQRLLPGFEEPQRRYRVLAQLSTGFFLPVGVEPADPMALTAQIVLTAEGGAREVIGVNVVGYSATRGKVAEETVCPGLPEALVPLRREIESMGRKSRKTVVVRTGIALERLEQRCLRLIRVACRDLEHRQRSDGRRTQHAKKRARQGDRPTSKALDDARQADDDQILEDKKQNTIVVLGQRGRAHFFSKAGKHVTSVVFEGRVIRQRMQQKRWVPFSKEEVAHFRKMLPVATGSHS